MSLTDDIEKALTGTGEKNPAVRKSAEQIAQAIANWQQKQKFEITQLKANIEVDNIKTTGKTAVDVKEDTIFGLHALWIMLFRVLLDMITDILNILGAEIAAGITIPGMGTIKEAWMKGVIEPFNLLEQKLKEQAKKLSGGGATIPPLDYKRKGGEAGALVVKGNTWINKSSKAQDESSVVELTKVVYV